MEPYVLAQEDSTIRVVYSAKDRVSYTIVQECNWSSQERLEGFQNRFQGMLEVSFSIRPAKMREEDYGLRIIFEEFLNGWDGA
jgi:hypothetical protein